MQGRKVAFGQSMNDEQRKIVMFKEYNPSVATCKVFKNTRRKKYCGRKYLHIKENVWKKT